MSMPLEKKISNSGVGDLFALIASLIEKLTHAERKNHDLKLTIERMNYSMELFPYIIIFLSVFLVT